MNTTPETAAGAAAPVISVEQLADILGYPARWKILRELSGGETRSIAELAEAAGCSYQSTLGHLKRMRQSGILTQGRGRLYQLPARFLSTPGQPIVDFGHCLLRFNVGK